MSLADHVRILGRGPGRTRSLSRKEAAAAMGAMLGTGAAPEAVGALLMLLRMKGETAEEIAGFAEAARAAIPGMPTVDLDWPSYAAGRMRGAPWFLLSARLVAAAGHRVLLHGWNGCDGSVRAGLQAAGIAVATDSLAARRLLDRDGIVYLPLEAAHPRLFGLLNLREVLGLRSCINTVCRMLNPGDARASVQGVFHPSYRLLQADAAALLGWRALSVVKGGGGEFECVPGKPLAVFGLRDGAPWAQTRPPVLPETRRLATPGPATFDEIATGKAAPDRFETEVILGTATLALETLGHAAADTLARDIWADRHSRFAA